MSEETVGWIGEADEPVDEADARTLVEPLDEETRRRATSVGRIAVALVVAWTALVAVPGALPWVATDDAARAIALGIVIASVVAIGGLALAWIRNDQIGVEGATFGTAAALAALGLAALAVVNLMILPLDAPYRLTAIGIGLLVLIALGLAAVATVRLSLFEGLRLSPMSLVGAGIGVVVVIAYLLMLQTMVASAPGADDAEWTRLTTLLMGIQTLAFAGLGAFIGIAVQGQVTSSVRKDLDNADAALALFEAEATDVVQEIRSRLADGGSETEAAIIDALRQDPARFKTEASLRRWIRTNRPEATDALVDLADSLDQVVASARRIRAG